MTRLRHAVFLAFHYALLAFSAVLIVGPLITAQTPRENRLIIETLQSEIKTIQDQGLDRRIAVLESQAQAQVSWMQINAGGTGLLLARATLTMLKNRKAIV